MQAFHNDPSIKQKYLDRVNFHIEADNLIRGNGWDGEKGCAVGCTLEKYERRTQRRAKADGPKRKSYSRPLE